MSACTFFEHKECPNKILDKIYNEIENLIIKHNVTTFYVGNQGNFDILAYNALTSIKDKYPNINIYIVLAYIPNHNNENLSNSIIPEGIELIHPRYAISKRNTWMIEHSEYVIYYITHNFDGASKFVEKARKKNKIMIGLL